MNKNYLIIGASSGVGIELLKELNIRESNAVFFAHYNGNISRIQSITAENGNRIVPLKADFMNQEEVKELIDVVIQEEKVPSVLVNLSAPKLSLKKFNEIDWDECIDDINVQVGGIVKIAQAILPKMLKHSQRAKVVFMLSENTIIEPAKYMMKYTMSKYMLLGFMKALSAEYSNRNVNINALSPTMIDTQMWSEVDERLLHMIDSKNKMLNAKDVADELLKLISHESDDMYGQNIYMPKVNS